MASTSAAPKKKNTRDVILRVLFYIVIIAICLFTLYPYFVTICTDQKKPLFWTNQKQNRFGDVAEAYLRDIPNIFPN